MKRFLVAGVVALVGSILFATGVEVAEIQHPDPTGSAKLLVEIQHPDPVGSIRIS